MSTDDIQIEDMLLDGNEAIEDAINRFCEDGSDENLALIMTAIHYRMRQDGQFVMPVRTGGDNNDSYLGRTVHTKDGKVWYVAFTSCDEFKKIAPIESITWFIGDMLKKTLSSDADGIIINPGLNAFFLTKDLINCIISTIEKEEYSVPDTTITAELLEDGSFLKRAVEICRNNLTLLNTMKLGRILRDSKVWIACNDYQTGGKFSYGHELIGSTNSLFLPDILKKGEYSFFPVYTSISEIGEYGENLSTIKIHFLEAVKLSKYFKDCIKGIMINPFSDSFVLPHELFDVIANMKSSVENDDSSSSNIFD